jgi:hypothetical protein
LAWAKPTFEIDFVKVYDNTKMAQPKPIHVFNIPGIDGLDLELPY